MNKKLLFSSVEKREGLSSLQLNVQYMYYDSTHGYDYQLYGYNFAESIGSFIPSNKFFNNSCTIDILQSKRNVHTGTLQQDFYFNDSSKLVLQYKIIHMQRKDTNAILSIPLNINWSGNNTNYLLEYNITSLFFTNVDVNKTIPLEIWFS